MVPAALSPDPPLLGRPHLGEQLQGAFRPAVGDVEARGDEQAVRILAVVAEGERTPRRVQRRLGKHPRRMAMDVVGWWQWW